MAYVRVPIGRNGAQSCRDLDSSKVQNTSFSSPSGTFVYIKLKDTMLDGGLEMKATLVNVMTDF